MFNIISDNLSEIFLISASKTFIWLPTSLISSINSCGLSLTELNCFETEFLLALKASTETILDLLV